MANYTAADVKKLRDLTDAPMMECKSALEEAGGDFERAQQILREKGKAAAAKRSDRATGAGVVAFATGANGVAGVVFESETDFVARNPEFIALAERAAQAVLDGGDVAEIEQEATAKFREKSAVSASVVFPAGAVTYVHHDKTKGAIVAGSGDADVLKKVAIQVVALRPQVAKKEDLSQDLLDNEYAIQLKRALDEGKPQNIAENIAKGRVNKEFIKEAVLTEQAYYADGSKTVGQYLQENGGASVSRFKYLAVGQGA